MYKDEGFLLNDNIHVYWKKTSAVVDTTTDTTINTPRSSNDGAVLKDYFLLPQYTLGQHLVVKRAPGQIILSEIVMEFSESRKMNTAYWMCTARPSRSSLRALRRCCIHGWCRRRFTGFTAQSILSQPPITFPKYLHAWSESRHGLVVYLYCYRRLQWLEAFQVSWTNLMCLVNQWMVLARWVSNVLCKTALRFRARSGSKQDWLGHHLPSE